MSHLGNMLRAKARLVGSCSSILFGLGLWLQTACAALSPSMQSPSKPTPPISELPSLQGTWEGEGDSGQVSITVSGDSLWFYARPDFQYDTTFVLIPDSDPAELHATILDSPRTTDSVGETVIAIFVLDGDTLQLAAVDKSEGASFDNALSRYRLQRAVARE